MLAHSQAGLFPAQQSVVIQGFYRSNYVILGIPIVSNIYGKDNIAVITMLVAVVVPIFNVMAVLLFEKFKGGRGYDLRTLLLGIVTNPLIIGSVLGLVCNALRLTFPTAVDQTIASISGIALPLALLILGADLDLSARTTNYRLLTFTVLGRLLIIPALFLPIAVLAGFRGQALASLTILYAPPRPSPATSWRKTPTLIIIWPVRSWPSLRSCHASRCSSLSLSKNISS